MKDDVIWGTIIGKAASFFPKVRGGHNFNPWTSRLLYGPKAAQSYLQQGQGALLNEMQPSKNCGCSDGPS